MHRAEAFATSMPVVGSSLLKTFNVPFRDLVSAVKAKGSALTGFTNDNTSLNWHFMFYRACFSEVAESKEEDL